MAIRNPIKNLFKKTKKTKKTKKRKGKKGKKGKTGGPGSTQKRGGRGRNRSTSPATRRGKAPKKAGKTGSK